MSRIVFFCIPAHGHTNPTLGVVRELVQRGHEVWYYSYEVLREKIEGAGARFVSCDPYDREQKLTEEDRKRIGKDLVFSIQVLADTTLALDETMCRHMRQLQPDCIVADSMAIWGKGAAKKLGIPFVCSTTTFAFNRYSARVMKKEGGGLLTLLLALPGVQKQIRRFRKAGYPFHSMLDILASDEHTRTIVYTSREFQPCGETFPACFSFVGPSIRPVEHPVKKLGDTLVYLSMGTVNNQMLPLYRTCLEALRDTGYQVILSVGDQVDPAEFGPQPDRVTICQHVDQIAVLEQADVFFSHCGMNSVSESLYFGVPLVLFPQTDEQRGVANRVEELGAGIRLTGTDKESIRQAVEQLLRNPDYRNQAKKIAEGFRACSGAKGAADQILEVCGEIPPKQ